MPLTPEDKIHIGVLGACTALALAWLPCATSPQRSAPPLTTPSRPAHVDPNHSKPPSLSELRQGIAQLDAAIDARHRQGGPPEAALHELRALGYTRISRGPQHLRMAGLLYSKHRDTVATTLTSLLESGFPPDRTLPFDRDAKTLGQWMTATLANGLSTPRPTPVSPSDLELLSFAQLTGDLSHNDQLAAFTRSSLTHLNQAYRPLTAQLGQGTKGGGSFTALKELKRTFASHKTADLHLSSAVLRAIAILRDESLRTAGLRHVHALIFRARQEVALFHSGLRLAAAGNPNRSGRLATLKTLGDLGQALHSASLNFPGSEVPPDELRTAIQLVSRALLTGFSSLKNRVLAKTPGATAEPPSELATASSALRALRMARIAVPR